jgi:hypothetical protein
MAGINNSADRDTVVLFGDIQKQNEKSTLKSKNRFFKPQVYLDEKTF